MSQALQEDNLSPKEVNTILLEFNDTLMTEAKKCMKLVVTQKKDHKKKRKVKGQKWFDKNCVYIKRRLENLAKLLVKKPKDPYIRGMYVSVKKQFGKTM